MKKLFIQLQRRYENYKQHKYMQGEISRLYHPLFYLLHSPEYCEKKEQEQLAQLRQLLDDYINEVRRNNIP